MTDEEARELGLRALAAGFESNISRTLSVEIGVRRDASGVLWRYGRDGAWPDFRDPATLGVLLEQVLDAGVLIRGMTVLPMGCSLNVEMPDGLITGWRRQTLVECLVAALEAAQ